MTEEAKKLNKQAQRYLVCAVVPDDDTLFWRQDPLLVMTCEPGGPNLLRMNLTELHECMRLLTEHEADITGALAAQVFPGFEWVTILVEPLCGFPVTELMDAVGWRDYVDHHRRAGGSHICGISVARMSKEDLLVALHIASRAALRMPSA